MRLAVPHLAMAFVSSPPISKALRTNSSCVLPTQRREYRNAVAKKRRSPVRCEMGENRTSETSSLLSESSRKESRDESTPSLDLEIEDGVSVADANEDASDSEEPAPGIIQKTTDLDGRVLFGEFLSTFLFVYLSVNAASSGSAVANSLNNAAVIAAVAASFMPVSGAHLNPAVTLSLAITKRVSLRRGIAFIPIQLLASAAACYLAAMLGTPMSFSGIAASATTTDLVRAFFAELMPMFIIVIILYQTAVATEREGGVGNKLAALYIGLAVLACAGTFSGVFNPARAFGPALVTWNFANHWIYWIGPFVGACAAALVRFHCEYNIIVTVLVERQSEASNFSFVSHLFS